MGIFNRSKTPPPPASDVSPQNTGPKPMHDAHQQPIVGNQTGTTYTPTSEMPAPQYTQDPIINNNHGINNAPPPADAPHYNEKTNAMPQAQQQSGYTSDPNLLHNQQQQQHVYPDHDAQYQQAQHSQSQIHMQQPPPPVQQYSNTDFHAQEKNQQAHAQPQHAMPHPPAQRNTYNVARPLHSLEGRSEVVDCPKCGVRELTRIEHVSGGSTHLAAALCCFCLCLGCIPYIGHWIKNCEHYCGNCGQLLAIWHRSSDTEVVARGPGGQNVAGAGGAPPAGVHTKPGGPGAV